MENGGRKFLIKLIDFGLSYIAEHIVAHEHDNCGTLIYMSPEMALEKEYNNVAENAPFVFDFRPHFLPPSLALSLARSFPPSDEHSQVGQKARAKIRQSPHTPVVASGSRWPGT